MWSVRTHTFPHSSSLDPVCALGAKHKGDVSSALDVCSHCGFSLKRASSSMHLIAAYSQPVSVMVCVFTQREQERERKEMRKRDGAHKCVHHQPNKLHRRSFTLPFSSSFTRASVTKGNVEGKQLWRWIKEEGSAKWFARASALHPPAPPHQSPL